MWTCVRIGSHLAVARPVRPLYAPGVAKTGTKELTKELAALAQQSAWQDVAGARKTLADALASQQATLIAQAARIIEEHKPSGFELPLRAAFRALSGPRASSLDPGAVAKLALVAALDALDDSDVELFGDAAQYVQLDRMKGGPRDTAAGVRARGLLGIARLGHPDWLLLLGAGLGDRDPTVRLSAARAVTHRGLREGAGLLLLRLGAGDELPEVLIECLRGLLALAPDLGLRAARTQLRDGAEAQREQTLHALGTAASDAAVELLAEELELQSLANEREPIIRALGLSRRPRARDLLITLVSGDRSSDAEAALSALAIHRYDERLTAQLRELTAHSRELSARFRGLFAS
ncbi:MAG: hypothetical protein ABW321_21545 [Polyangiales bacterium]